MIRLLHTETKGFLSADINYETPNSDPEVWISKYLGEYNLETKSVNNIWILESFSNELPGDFCKYENEN